MFMSNFKNRKPKSYKGCCGMCCLRTTDGRRNGRLRTLQELRAEDSAREQLGEPRQRARVG